ncbi:calcium-binding protein [Tolypothrix bouteillei VB521301_2]|uniref:Calcium-binding protein n=1 Tax=Tolypothrix bouteillei VB521301 TaxID=1479485 RepID=A0A0C1NMH9_9CYAN
MAEYKYYNGTSGADNLVGENLPNTYNVFFAGDGNDTITGAATRDFVYAGGGNDTVWGFGGDDGIYGYEGNDYLEGGTGNDEITGDTGQDKLVGVQASNWNAGKGEIDLLVGGSLNHFSYNPTNPTVSTDTERDTFVLGDTYEAYYLGDGSLGEQDFALIPDFNPSIDNIVLHGKAQDYVVGGISQNLSYQGAVINNNSLGLYLSESGGYDLVAVLQNVSFSNINLYDTNQFTFV